MRKTLAIMIFALGMGTAGAAQVQPALLFTNVWIYSSANPSYAGLNITLTGQVLGGCTGTITFLDGSTGLGTSTISSGYAYLQVSTLSVGTHSLTASYSGSSVCAQGSVKVASR